MRMYKLFKQANAFAVCYCLILFVMGCGQTSRMTTNNSLPTTCYHLANVSPDGVFWRLSDDGSTRVRVIPEMTVDRLSELVLSEDPRLVIRISADPNTKMEDVFRVADVIKGAGCSSAEFGAGGTFFRVVWGRIGAYPREHEGEPIRLHMVRADSSPTETVLVIATPVDSPASPPNADPNADSVLEQWLISGDCTAGNFLARLHGESVSPGIPHVDALFAMDNAASFQKMVEGWPLDSLEPDSNEDVDMVFRTLDERPPSIVVSLPSGGLPLEDNDDDPDLLPYAQEATFTNRTNAPIWLVISVDDGLAYSFEYQTSSNSPWTKGFQPNFESATSFVEVPPFSDMQLPVRTPLRLVKEHHRLLFTAYWRKSSGLVPAFTLIAYPGEPEKTEIVLCSP